MTLAVMVEQLLMWWMGDYLKWD